MAWSNEARAAALASRRAHAHMSGAAAEGRLLYGVSAFGGSLRMAQPRARNRSPSALPRGGPDPFFGLTNKQWNKATKQIIKYQKHHLAKRHKAEARMISRKFKVKTTHSRRHR